MKTIEQMLRLLARPDVSEFAIASGRLPCVKRGGSYQPVDDVAPTSDQIVQMLVAVGGSRYVDGLGPKPTQWTTRMEGVGAITIAAVMRDDKVQARFVLSRREEQPGVAASKTPSTVQSSQTPSASGTARTPSALGTTRTPSATGTTRTPSTVRGRSNRPPARAAKSDPPTLDRPIPAEVAAKGKSAPGLVPDLDLAVPGAMRMVELDATEAPTKPGAVGMSIELDLERAVAAVRVGVSADEQQGTARDLEFDDDGKAAAASPTTSRHAAPALLDEMLEAARNARASDLHVIAERPLLFRVAGELRARGEPLSPETVEAALLARVPARCRPQLEKDGSCDFALEHGVHGRFRVNVTRQRTGLKACLRLIPREIPTLASLGLPQDIAKATHHHQGLIVVTGPTGHGKTSTLAAIVDIINSETTHHVITVEDPVEYVHPRKRALMSQREIGSHTLSFENALKAALREDPDVIVVGELRDTETVRMALAASETGHLVLGTMNTPSAAKTIDRLIDLFPPADQQQVRMTLAGGLRLVVSQRLLPSPDGESMAAAAELLPGSIALWTLIRDNKTFQIPSLQQRGKGAGILRLDDSLAELVRAWKTTKEAALAIAENPAELERELGKAVGQEAAAPRAPAPSAPEINKNEPRTGILQRAGSLFGGKKG